MLDEADFMTADAQAALRRTMEKYSIARFILTANDLDPIMDAIRSRCTVYEFEKLAEFEIVEKLREIARAEGLAIEDWVLYSIAKESDGDLRRAINRLQGIVGSCRVD